MRIQISMRLPKKLKEKIDQSKGYKSFTAWIIEAIEEKLKKEISN